MGTDIMPLKRFKDEHNFEKRAEGSDIPEIDRKKYLVPQELTVGQFVYVVRKRLRLPQEKAIFISVDGRLPSTGAALMSQMYKDYKDQDGFLYVTYSGENTFGGVSVHLTTGH